MGKKSLEDDARTGTTMEVVMNDKITIFEDLALSDRRLKMKKVMEN